MTFIERIIERFRQTIKLYSNKYTATAAIIIIVFLGIGMLKVAFSPDAVSDTSALEREVRTAPAGLISKLESVFESTGEVRSQTQGDLRAERAGVITRVYATVGQYVRAGTIIATIENASERASVSQAQATVAQAQASLDKVTGGTRNEQLAVLSATVANATQNIEEARVGTKNTLLTAYTVTSSTFGGAIDALFNNPDGANPTLTFSSVHSSNAIASEHARFILQATIDRHVLAATTVLGLNDEDLRNEIETIEDDMFSIKEALDNIISALDGAVINASVNEATIATYKTTASSARSSVLATLSQLSTARSALNSAQTALTVAQENQDQGVTGAQKEDIDAAQAQVDAAQAGLAQTIARLETTRVRAPVTGIVSTLTIDKGDFVSAFQDVGLVANESSLEIVAFVSPNIVNRLSIGTSALINGKYEGVVTSIAHGLDSVTRQVEVRIAFAGEDVEVVHGSRLSLKFLSSEGVTEETDAQILVPIAALKLIGSDAFVYTVNEENTLVAHEVILGEVVQASVEIVSGIDRDTVIVLDARGLNSGDIVIIGN